MGKYTYIGGDYFENIGGSKIVYVKGNNETHSNGQIIQTAEKVISFGKPKDPPERDEDIQKEGPWLVLRSTKKKGRNPKNTATAADLLYGDYPDCFVCKIKN